MPDTKPDKKITGAGLLNGISTGVNGSILAALIVFGNNIEAKFDKRIDKVAAELKADYKELKYDLTDEFDDAADKLDKYLSNAILTTRVSEDNERDIIEIKADVRELRKKIEEIR